MLGKCERVCMCVKVGNLFGGKGEKVYSTDNFKNISPCASFIALAHFCYDYYKEWFGSSEVPLFSCKTCQREKDGGAVW